MLLERGDRFLYLPLFLFVFDCSCAERQEPSHITAIVLLSEYMLLRIGIIAFSKAHLLVVLVSRAIHKSLNVGIGHTAVGKLLDNTVFRSHSINKLLPVLAVKLGEHIVSDLLALHDDLTLTFKGSYHCLVSVVDLRLVVVQISTHSFHHLSKYGFQDNT